MKTALQRFAVTAGAGAALLVAAIAPAGAAMASPMKATGSPVTPAGWRGACHLIEFNSGNLYPWAPTGYEANWCDGNGPDSYRTYVYCSDNQYHFGPWKWYGDRTGSWAYCPTNLKADFNKSGVQGS